jgi:hypothetical protein
MKNKIRVSIRILTVFLFTFSVIGVNFPASAQTPPPPTAPTLQPENNPLAPNAPITAVPTGLPKTAAFGGSANVPQSVNANYSADDRYNTSLTGWQVWEHQTPADVTAKINSGLRLEDIYVESFSPSYVFTGVYVSNTGTYAKSWWWYYDVDGTTLSNLLSTNNARLTSLKAYDIGGGVIHFTAVMISNTGSDSTAWWWYYNETISGLSTLLTTNNARISQVHSYVTGGQTRYAAIMVDNQGANNLGWWWYVNASPATVSSLISTNNARLVDLDIDSTTGNVNAVMVSCTSGCPFWWWYVGVPTSQLLTIAGQDGARIIDANTYPGCGDMCWDFLLINNSNAITSRVGNILRTDTDGTVGLYLEQLGGPILANLMDSTPFEPASTIKATVHLYTMRALQSGPDTLATQITKYVPPVGSSCPGTTSASTEDIQTADREMMWHSDNTRTAELVDHYTRAAINTMITSIGMSNTSINHVIGCGGPIPDQTTLDDLATLYKGVANATLVDAAHRTLFFSQMAGKSQFLSEGYDWTGLWDTDIPKIIAAEAPAGMPQYLKDAFRNKMELAYKAGNYKICTSGGCATYVDHISIFGYAQIPFCGVSTPRQYVFGVYIYNSTSDTLSSNAFTATKAELLREQIHAGLASCFYNVYLPASRN